MHTAHQRDTVILSATYPHTSIKKDHKTYFVQFLTAAQKSMHMLTKYKPQGNS